MQVCSRSIRFNHDVQWSEKTREIGISKGEGKRVEVRTKEVRETIYEEEERKGVEKG